MSKRPNTANVHFHFPFRNLQPQTCGLIYKFHEEMHGRWKCWQRLESLRIFHTKMSVNQLNIRGVCLEYSVGFWIFDVSINLFWLRKILIVLFVTKQYQPFCVRQWFSNFFWSRTVCGPRTDITYHLVSRKSQCAKYHSIKSLENQNWHKCNVNKMAVRNFNCYFQKIAKEVANTKIQEFINRTRQVKTTAVNIFFVKKNRK